MDPEGPGVVLAGLLHSPSEALVAAWNKKATEALDGIMLMQPLLSCGSCHSP